MKPMIALTAAILLLSGCGEPQDKLSDEEASIEQGPAVLDNGVRVNPLSYLP